MKEDRDSNPSFRSPDSYIMQAATPPPAPAPALALGEPIILRNKLCLTDGEVEDLMGLQFLLKTQDNNFNEAPCFLVLEIVGPETHVERVCLTQRSAEDYIAHHRHHLRNPSVGYSSFIGTDIQVVRAILMKINLAPLSDIPF